MNKNIIVVCIIIISIYYYRDNISQKISSWNKKNELQKTTGIPSYYLVNVLDKKEFNDAHIKGSINIPFSQVNSFLNDITNKEIPLLFYCSNYYCTASDAAAKIAIKKGFTTVFVYKGGMAEWYQTAKVDSAFEYEGPAQEEYLQIVILPQEEILDPELDIIDDDTIKEESFKIISINNLQNFLKEGNLIK